jgi:hypothetical protein
MSVLYSFNLSIAMIILLLLLIFASLSLSVIALVGGMNPGMPKACQTGLFKLSKYRFKGYSGLWS